MLDIRWCHLAAGTCFLVTDDATFILTTRDITFLSSHVYYYDVFMFLQNICGLFKSGPLLQIFRTDRDRADNPY